MNYEAVIGLEVHAELDTKTKMFCACPIVDVITAKPNTAVCPICAGMPGTLPVINQHAVEYALRVALALQCEINLTSIFARKNYFYPDLPKGYQISQYEQPLAVNGKLTIFTSQGEKVVHIRRVHMEEDTGKLTHIHNEEETYSLVDLNRAGVPLLEIVTEPDMHSDEEVRAYATALRSLLRYLGVNTGDMEKGKLRIEPNVSVRPITSEKLGTRTEIKNLNSFKVLEQSVAYEIRRQSALLERGEPVIQQTLGWDAKTATTVPQRSKEEAHDYRYFPEPDLPPLVLDNTWVNKIRVSIPELPAAKQKRFLEEYGLNEYDSNVLTNEQAVANFFEETVKSTPGISPKDAANWITGDLFGLLNQSGKSIEEMSIHPEALGNLIHMVEKGIINQTTAKSVLAEMFTSGKSPDVIVEEKSLQQISDSGKIAEIVEEVFANNPEQLQAYLAGKETIANWLLGQVMRATKGQANVAIVKATLDKKLVSLKRDDKNHS